VIRPIYQKTEIVISERVDRLITELFTRLPEFRILTWDNLKSYAASDLAAQDIRVLQAQFPNFAVRREDFV
jgi:hypothetical protein